jgi:Cu/Ag efflux protein CusF
MEGMIRTVTVALAALLLAACHHLPDHGGKRYTMQGKVVAIDTANKSASIDAGQIGDWMAPMTMDYPVKPERELQKIKVGDRIEATVIVNEPAYYVTDIKVAAKP